MRDIKLIIPERNFEANLTSHNLETITVDEQAPSIDFDRRESSSVGYTSSYGKLLSKSITLTLRFKSATKQEYQAKESEVLALFGHVHSMTVKLYESMGAGYDFEKPNSTKEIMTTRYLVKSWDVISATIPEIERSGLTGTVTISLITEKIPFSYKDTVKLTLTKEDSKVKGTGRVFNVKYTGSKSLDSAKLSPLIKLTGVSANNRYSIESGGKSIKINSSILLTQTFSYNGYKYLKDTINVARDSNLGGIILRKGINEVYVDTGRLSDLDKISLYLEFKEYSY